jgi:hypothetical protein
MSAIGSFLPQADIFKLIEQKERSPCGGLSETRHDDLTPCALKKRRALNRKRKQDRRFSSGKTSVEARRE